MPGAGVDVKINNGAASNSATIVAPGALARAVEIGTAVGQSGRLNVASGALTIGAGGLTIGNLGSGSFNISGGGTVSTSSAFVALNPGSNGTVVISGAGSKLTASQVYVGDDAGATGQVTLQNGASLVSSVTVLGYFSATASGTLTLSGSTGSTFTNSGSFTIGERGAGTFNLLAGSTATAGTVLIGSSAATGNGTANISDSGTTWTTGNTNVGTIGTGALTISNGASVTTNRTTNIIPTVSIGGTAAVTGSGSQWLIDANPAGGTAAALGIGSKANVASSLTIGNGGKVTIRNTATGTSGQYADVRIGVSAGSTATLTVSGAGSSMTTPYIVYAGYAANSTGSIVVNNGGTLNTGYTSIGSGATGSATVTGDGSTWTVTDSQNVSAGLAQGLAVGLGAATSKGTLTIADGGVVNVNSTGRSVNLGGSAGSQATLNIGAAAGSPAVAPGTLNADRVVFVTGATSAINFNHTSNNYVFAPAINGTGPGAVNFLAGTTILAGNNPYTGTMTIASGATAQLGNGGSTGLVTGSIADNGTLIFNVSSFQTYGGVISGSGAVEQRGPDTLTFTANNTYAGLTTISSGTLQIGNGGTTGSIAGNVLNNSRIAFRRSDSFTYNGVISGSGSFTKDGVGAMTLGNVSTYTGGTSVSQGILRLGGSNRIAATGSLFLFSTGTFDLAGFNQTVGDLSGPGTVATGTGTFTAGTANDRSFAGRVTGSGSFIKQGSGALTLSGDNSAYAGATSVAAGRLLVNGTLGGSTTVLSGGTLGGSGVLAGPVSVSGGGTLQGQSGQSLTMGSLALADGANVNVALGTPGGARLFSVTGNLTLDGTLNATGATGFGEGVYRIFDYGGALADNGMTVGAMPSGTSGALQTAVANQVNLIVVASGPVPTIQFWNGTHTTPNGTVNGGSGIWSASTTNWTDAAGTRAFAWGGNFAVFQGTPGTVAVEGAGVSATGIQFAADGYRLTGGAVTLNGADGSTTVRVGDGTAAGAGFTAVVDAALTGGSRLVKDDLGTLVLTGVNSYRGGTTIAAGTLQIGNGGTTGAILGDVANNGLLRFARNDASTFDGAISGSGRLQVQSGSLILTGNSSYTGATTIAAGATLQLGNGGGVGSITSDVANAGTFAFNGAGALVYGGAISGNGLIRQIGAGITSLTGDSSAFAGNTQVESGVLSVNGKLGGTLTVLAGGQLQGVGTVGNVAVAGTLAPGNSIGTLNVGNVTFQAGSIYQVEVNADGQSDKIVAAGTATINGGSVQVLAGQGSYQANTTYTILTAAGGRTGTFAGVTSNLAFLAPSLSYDPDNVYLTLTRNTVSFPSIGGTFNQRQAGAGAESLGPGNPIWNAVVQMDASTAQAAFNQLSGEVHASAKTALYEDSRLVRDGALGRLRQAFGGGAVASSTAEVAGLDEACSGDACQADPGTGIAAWAQGFGSWGYTSTDGNAAGLSRSTGGMLVGVDAPVFDVARLGLFGGYSRTSFNVADRQSSGGSDNVHLGAYGGAQWGPIGVRAGLAYTWHNLSTSRSVAFPGFADSLRATYGAGTFQLFGEAGYRFDVGPATFEPFANIAWMSLSTKGFSETGGAAALSSAAITSNVTTTTVGLRAGSAFTIAGLTGQARGTVGWQHAFTDTTPWANLQLAGGTPFTAAGVPIAQDAALLELGVDLRLSDRASLGIGYTGQFAAGSQDQSVRGNVTFRF